jgi:hypothetical protein
MGEDVIGGRPPRQVMTSVGTSIVRLGPTRRPQTRRAHHPPLRPDLAHVRSLKAGYIPACGEQVRALSGAVDWPDAVCADGESRIRCDGGADRVLPAARVPDSAVTPATFNGQPSLAVSERTFLRGRADESRRYLSVWLEDEPGSPLWGPRELELGPDPRQLHSDSRSADYLALCWPRARAVIVLGWSDAVVLDASTGAVRRVLSAVDLLQVASGRV